MLERWVSMMRVPLSILRDVLPYSFGALLLLFAIGAAASQLLLWRIRKVVIAHGFDFPDSRGPAWLEGLRHFHTLIAEETDPAHRNAYRLLLTTYYACVGLCFAILLGFAVLISRLTSAS